MVMRNPQRGLALSAARVHFSLGAIAEPLA
jgi:hypothetical protein